MFMESRGLPPISLLEQGNRSKIFFDEQTKEPLLPPNTRGKVRTPNSKNLAKVLGSDDPQFLDFMRRCLEWDPEKRLTPE